MLGIVLPPEVQGLIWEAGRMRCLVVLLVNDYGGKVYPSSGRCHLSNYSRYFRDFLSHLLPVAHVPFRFGACLVAFSNEIEI